MTGAVYKEFFVLSYLRGPLLSGDRAEFQVPGATVKRPPNLGQVPGGRWVRVTGQRGIIGFASDALYDFDAGDGEFRATVCRASRYADDVKTPPEHEPWRPAHKLLKS